jgi:hypothetical protein
MMGVRGAIPSLGEIDSPCRRIARHPSPRKRKEGVNKFSILRSPPLCVAERGQGVSQLPSGTAIITFINYPP